MPKGGLRETLGDNPRLGPEKHDRLYSKARFVLNQRHIKRPWFNLNPFLEKTDETIDLESFVPEESKYVQRLESLVLCENLDEELPLDTREIELDDFFAYLYSDEWKAGCSVRILEGQVLDELLLGLYTMEHEEIVVRHTTYAIANNDRTLTSCYKHANKEAYGTVKETLLLEFAYFGRLTKDGPNLITMHPFDYIERTNLSDLEEEIKEEEVPKKKGKGKKKKRPRANSLVGCEGTLFRGMNLTLPAQAIHHRPTGRQYLMSKSINAIRFMNALQNPPTKKCKKQTGAHGTSEHEDHAKEGHRNADKATAKSRRNAMDCSRLTKEKRKKKKVEEEDSSEFEDDFDDYDDIQIARHESEPEVVEEEEKDVFFGDEFYLSDMNARVGDRPKSALKLLQQKREQLNERRKDMREEMALRKWKAENSGVPKLPPLDKSKIRTVAHDTIRMPDKMPTFEEFLVLLKADDFYDPRYRNRIRMKEKKIAQRYFAAKRIEESSISFGYGKYARRNKTGTSSQESVINTLPPITSSSSKRSSNKVSTTSLPRSNPSEMRQQRRKESLEVLGVTDSDSCKDHYYRETTRTRSREKKTPSDGSDDNKETSSSGTPSQSAGKSLAPLSISKRQSHEKVHGYTAEVKFPPTPEMSKVAPSCKGTDASPSYRIQKLPPDSIESSSESSDDETPESTGSEEEELFDAGKLNIRYSIERLKKKRKNKTPRKKPAFAEILSKYYKFHNMLNCLQKPSPPSTGRRGSIAKPKPAPPKGLAVVAKVFGRRPMMSEKKSIPKPKMVVGKLKHFKFQDKKRPEEKAEPEDKPRWDFKPPNREKFREHLKQALEDFVVRREIVVSNIHTFYNSTTSVTFTKFTCFQEKHTH